MKSVVLSTHFGFPIDIPAAYQQRMRNRIHHQHQRRWPVSLSHRPAGSIPHRGPEREIQADRGHPPDGQCGRSHRKQVQAGGWIAAGSGDRNEQTVEFLRRFDHQKWPVPAMSPVPNRTQELPQSDHTRASAADKPTTSISRSAGRYFGVIRMGSYQSQPQRPIPLRWAGERRATVARPTHGPRSRTSLFPASRRRPVGPRRSRPFSA